MTDPGAATLVELLERVRETHGTGLRLVDRDESESWRDWAEIAERGTRAAGRLAALGIRSGDRVALVFPTSWGFFDAFFGVLLAGAVPVPLYPPVRFGRLDEYHRTTAGMVTASGARLLLADPRVMRLMGETARRARPPLGCRTLDELPSGAGGRPAPPAAGDLALVQFSSGTTTDPKPVALSHRAVMSQVSTLNGFWPDGDVRHSGVSWLPLYHDMGLIGCVLPALERPATMTLIPPEVFVTRPATWLRAISRHRATISPAPNFAYGLCVTKVADGDLAGVDLSSWRVALNGAESVSARVMREFVERFAPWGLRREALTPVYGLSEAALAVTFSDLDREFRSRRVRRDRLGQGDVVEEDPAGTEIASVGRPLPGFELELRRSDGSPSAAGEVGRIWIRGPSLMEEYLGRPRLTARVLRDGWLDTGDLGFLLDGELHLAGRAKDLVIVRGRNYAPEDLERAVDRVVGVRRGCVAAVSAPFGSSERDAADGERVLVFVERDRAAKHRELAGLAERCAAELVAGVGIEPDEIIVLPPGTLPRTSSGKIRRAETLRRHLAGELLPSKRAGWWLIVKELVRSRWAFLRTGRGGRDPRRAAGAAGDEAS